MVNIWDLPIGGIGITDSGIELTAVRDVREKRPMLGVVPIRICEDRMGRVQKFIRGIEVTPKDTPNG